MIDSVGGAKEHGAPLPGGWGREVVVEEIDGHPCRVYAPRRHRVGELLGDALRWGPRDHLVQGDRRISFGQHHSAIQRVASLLRHDGVGAGDRVALLAASSPEWIVTWWAALRIGAIAVPFNAWWSADEVAHAVGDCRPRVVMADAEGARRLPAGVALLERDRVAGMIDADGDGSAGSDDPSVDPGSDESDPAVILYTSGTTGYPKGVVLSHRAVVANVHNFLLATRRLPPDLAADHPAPVSLLTVPLFHLSGLQAFLTALLAGGRLVFLTGRFDPGEVLELVERERVSIWAAVPTMVQRVLEHPDLARRDCSSLRSLAMGGAPVAPETIERARRAFSGVERKVVNVYGLTESGGVVSVCAASDMEAHPDSVGRPLPVVEVQIADPDPEGVGEILVRSPAVMNGYWGRPDDATVDAQGWLRTGDLGRVADGLLFLVDRSKDLVIRGGENVASVHVEARLLSHPAVSEAAVVGLPHPDLGEEVGAVVVVRPGCAVGAEELRGHARRTLAPFEVPTRWWFREAPLPTSAVGKVLKRDLRRAWIDVLEDEEAARRPSSVAAEVVEP